MRPAGGGIPIVRPIQQDLRGNALTEINGIVNGSTNYLLTEMREKGVSFPAALGEAKRLGYVEANPAADVEGWDARRKIAILANAAFGGKLADNQIVPPPASPPSRKAICGQPQPLAARSS